MIPDGPLNKDLGLIIEIRIWIVQNLNPVWQNRIWNDQIREPWTDRPKYLPRNMELSISFFLSSLRRFVFSSMIANDFLFSLVSFRRNRIFSRVWIFETLSITFSVSSAYDFFKMSTCSKISCYNVARTQNCPKMMKIVTSFVPFSM